MKTCRKGLHTYPKEKKCCPECSKLNAKLWRHANADRNNANIKAWRDANPERFKSIMKSCVQKWSEVNPERKKTNLRRWQLANPDKCTFHANKRRAQKLHATPPWLSEEHWLEIEQYYDMAKELQWLSEEPLEVDHIVPLQGENVSGLHVPWNLQILPKSLNGSKGNRIPS